MQLGSVQFRSFFPVQRTGPANTIGVGSRWALEQSEGGGGTPAMGAVGKMGGEGRLGVGVERTSIWGACETSQIEERVGVGTKQRGRWHACDGHHL